MGLGSIRVGEFGRVNGFGFILPLLNIKHKAIFFTIEVFSSLQYKSILMSHNMILNESTKNKDISNEHNIEYWIGIHRTHF